MSGQPTRKHPATWVPTLYFAEGLPFYAVNFMALAFYQRMGVSNTVITFVISLLAWPWTLKPTSGTLEVVFQHLLGRPPFDDTGVRDELRQRVNRIPGVDIPLSRLELRPSFPLARLAADEGLTAAIDTHTWFVDRLRRGTEAA